MQRLQKVLASAGVASRRAAEAIILAGRVRVDGRIVRELGTQVDPQRARVEVDGVKLVAERLIYVILHKPRGVVCTLSDPEGRPTIRELVSGAGGRIVPVGRLDFHTSGALLCTNDGEFAQALAHPKLAVPKVYVAKVMGTVDDDALELFRQKIVVDGRATRPAEVRRLRFEGDKTWLEITLREGRNRQVRRLGDATGFPVMRLARLSHAGVSSDEIRPGEWRHLTVDELTELKREFGVPKKVRPAAFDPDKPDPGRLKGHETKKQWGARPSRDRHPKGRGQERTVERFESASSRGRESAPSRGRESAPSRGRESAPSRGRESAKKYADGGAAARSRGAAVPRGRPRPGASDAGKARAPGREATKPAGRGSGPRRGTSR